MSLNEKAIAELWATPITIADLPPGGLGATTNGAITLSPNASGWGWFIDLTPYTDSSFPNVSADGLSALPGSSASGEMDLLTVEMHELAHVLGYGDTSSGLMSEYLSPGVRLAPAVDAASGIGSQGTAPTVNAAASGNGSHGTATAAIHAGDPSGQSATDQLGAQGSKSEPRQAPATAPVTVNANATPRYNLLGGAPFALPANQMVVPQSGSAVADSTPSASYLGSLTQSEITVGPKSPQLSLRSGDLIGKFVDLDMSVGWSGETTAREAGDTLAEDGTSVQPESSSAPATSSHSAAKQRNARDIGNTGSPESVDRAKAAFSQDWLDDYLNNLGQNGSVRDPNAGIRVHPKADGIG